MLIDWKYTLSIWTCEVANNKTKYIGSKWKYYQVASHKNILWYIKIYLNLFFSYDNLTILFISIY
jgi:hypothetical protein